MVNECRHPRCFFALLVVAGANFAGCSRTAEPRSPASSEPAPGATTTSPAAGAVAAKSDEPRRGKDSTAASPTSVAASTGESHAGPIRCEVVCEGTKVIRHEISPDESAEYYTAQAAKKADKTLAEMRDDLLSCYTKRVKEFPKAHAFMTIDIVVGPEGRVRDVETQGGALLGKGAIACIVDRIKQGEFAPPRGGGTMRLEVPFTLRRLAPGEAI